MDSRREFYAKIIFVPLKGWKVSTVVNLTPDRESQVSNSQRKRASPIKYNRENFKILDLDGIGHSRGTW